MKLKAAAHQLRRVLPRALRWGYFAGVILILIFGFWLRSRLYFSVPPLWLDETSWAKKLVTQPLESLYVRPLGFMWLTLKFVERYGFSELTLRILPYFSACATLPVVWLILRELVSSRSAQLLGLLLCAVHPWFIDYGVEFKPYAVELFLHLLLFWCCLRELRKPQHLLVLLAFSACAAIGFLLAYNLIFLYPAFFGVLLFAILRRGAQSATPRLQRILVLAIAGGCAVIFILWIRSTALASVVKNDESVYWANKYDVFFGGTGATVSARVDWFVDKYLSMTRAPAVLNEWGWGKRLSSPIALRELTAVTSLAWLGLHFVGVGSLIVRRQWTLLILLLSPMLVSVGFNLAGKWPLGLFRTNVFMLGYFILLGLLGLDALLRQRRPSARRASLALAFLLILPGATLALGGRTQKGWAAADTPKSLALLATLATRPDIKAKRVPVYCDSYSCSDLETYTRHHKLYSSQRALFRGPYRMIRGYHLSDIIQNLQRQTSGVAIVVMGRPSELAKARANLGSACTQITIYEETQIPLIALCVRDRR